MPGGTLRILMQEAPNGSSTGWPRGWQVEVTKCCFVLGLQSAPELTWWFLRADVSATTFACPSFIASTERKPMLSWMLHRGSPTFLLGGNEAQRFCFIHTSIPNSGPQCSRLPLPRLAALSKAGQFQGPTAIAQSSQYPNQVQPDWRSLASIDLTYRSCQCLRRAPTLGMSDLKAPFLFA